MKICPICKKENLTTWKYCSNDCISHAKKLAINNRKIFIEELKDELLSPKQFMIKKGIVWGNETKK